MTKGLQTKRLSDLYQIGSSKRVLKSQWKTEGVPFYRGREVTRLAADGFVDNELFISEKHFGELSKEYGVPKAGDIVITAIGTIGNSHIVRSSDRFYFKDASVLWLKRTTDVSSEFVNWWLKSSVFFDQLDRGNGATVDTLSIQKLQSVEITVPPLAEQQRIVGLLDEAFAGLATAKANAEKNLQNARALFESHLQSVFTQGGPGWKPTKLGDEIDLLAGFAFKSKQYTTKEDDVRLLRGDNIIQACLRWDDVKRWPANDTKEYERYWLREGDVVLAMDRPWVKAGLKHATIATDDLPCLLVQRTARLRGEANLDNRFLMLLIGSSAFTSHILGVQTGIGVPHISGQQIKDFEFVRPPLAEQRRIADKLESLREETQRLASLYERKLAALEALKKSLLHQAFAGEL